MFDQLIRRWGMLKPAKISHINFYESHEEGTHESPQVSIKDDSRCSRCDLSSTQLFISLLYIS